MADQKTTSFDGRYLTKEELDQAFKDHPLPPKPQPTTAKERLASFKDPFRNFQADVSYHPGKGYLYGPQSNQRKIRVLSHEEIKALLEQEQATLPVKKEEKEKVPIGDTTALLVYKAMLGGLEKAAEMEDKKADAQETAAALLPHLVEISVLQNQTNANVSLLPTTKKE